MLPACACLRCAQLAPKQRQLEEQRQRNANLAEQLSKLKAQLAETNKQRQQAQEEGRKQVQVCAASPAWNKRGRGRQGCLRA